jgi:hypothetical protein
LILDWLGAFRRTRKEKSRRAYYARREAEALRMQHGLKAEAWCRDQLAKPNIGFRRQRFLKLVAKALDEV